MCLAAMYVSGIQQGFYAFSIEEAPGGLSLGGTMYEQFQQADIRAEHEARSPSAAERWRDPLCVLAASYPRQ